MLIVCGNLGAPPKPPQRGSSRPQDLAVVRRIDHRRRAGRVPRAVAGVDRPVEGAGQLRGVLEVIAAVEFAPHASSTASSTSTKPGMPRTGRGGK